MRNFFIRPVNMRDVKNLLTMVKHSSGGLSSLQPRFDFLKDYVATSEASFSGEKNTEDPHKYLLAMFDCETDALVGCSAVKTQTGIDVPFINFDVIGDGLEQYLVSSNRFKGGTEVGSCLLYTSPSPRDATLSRMPSSA